MLGNVQNMGLPLVQHRAKIINHVKPKKIKIMGTITKGILGGFSGTVGTVVGANWRGKDIIRSRPKKSSKEPTEAQIQQQLKFRLVMKFLTPVSAIPKMYFGSNAGARSRLNLACSYTIREAVVLNAGIPELVFNKVIFTKGELPGFQNFSVTPKAGGELEFGWSDNSAQAYAKATDCFETLVYCDELEEFQTFDNNEQRDAATASQILPERFRGKPVHLYCFFRNADRSKASNSLYAGEVTVLP